MDNDISNYNPSKIAKICQEMLNLVNDLILREDNASVIVALGKVSSLAFAAVPNLPEHVVQKWANGVVTDFNKLRDHEKESGKAVGKEVEVFPEESTSLN